MNINNNISHICNYKTKEESMSWRGRNPEGVAGGRGSVVNDVKCNT